MNRGLLLAILCLALPASAAVSGTYHCPRTADMPAGLKLNHYRGPTPECVPNATTLSVSELQELQRREPSPILVDVLAILLRQETGFPSVWLPNEPHRSLPGAVWLPNVGYGKLKPDIEHYLRSNLQRLTNGDKTKPLVFFCVADCWMSWNVVQRVREYGYESVYWFKEGVDGWAEEGLPLLETAPVPIK